MWFLLKCLMVFALFYAIAAAEPRAKTPRAEAKIPAAGLARRNLAPHPDEVFANVRRAAADELLAAAREKCLENSSGCVAALKAAAPSLAAAATRR